MGLGTVEGRKSPSPIDKATGLYSSLYYRTSRELLLLTNDYNNYVLLLFLYYNPFCTYRHIRTSSSADG